MLNFSDLDDLDELSEIDLSTAKIEIVKFIPSELGNSWENWKKYVFTKEAE